MTMKVNEVFFSIQGESSFMGCPCAFIRFTACNLRCTYCDTEYAFAEGREMSIPGILDALTPFPTRLVLVTGGEPMLQKDIGALFQALLERGYTVCLETGGHMPLQDVDPRVHKIMDWKCPSSGMPEHNHYDNIRFLTRIDEVKFVVGHREDFDWACRMVAKYELTERVGAVLFSPVYHVLPYDDLARWILESGLPVRMQLQLHKIIWPGVARGV
jgi:7-carboxy-7-deazaguanine synthase